MSLSKKWQKATLVILVALCMLLSGIALKGFNASATEVAAGWANVTTATVSGAEGVTTLAPTSGNKKFVAKYNKAINMANGLEFDVTLTGTDVLSGKLSQENGATVILSNGELSADGTGTKAWVIRVGNLADKIGIAMWYVNNCKLAADGVGYTFETEGVPATNDIMDNADFVWTNDRAWNGGGHTFNFKAKLDNGSPMFWIDDTMLSPYGTSGHFLSEADNKNTVVSMKTLHETFMTDIDTAALSLYMQAQSTHATSAPEVKISTVDTAVDFKTAGWYTTEGVNIIGDEGENAATFELIENDASNWKRTRYIYGKTFKLSEFNVNDSIKFDMWVEESSNLDGQDWVSIRSGFMMDALANNKNGGKAESKLFDNGPNLGIWDNSGNAQSPAGLVSTPPTPFTDKVEDGWKKRTVEFKKSAADMWQWFVNGTAIATYSPELIAFMGDEVSLIVQPSEKSAAGYKMRLTNFSCSITCEDADKDFIEDSDSDITFALSLDSGVNVSSVKKGSTLLTDVTDYSLEGANLTFKATYLKTLALGAHEFTVTSNEGTTVNLTITVIPAFSITVTTGSATAVYGEFTDLVLTCATKNEPIESVKLDNVALVADTDYLINEFVVTVKASTLNKLRKGNHALRIITANGYADLTVTVNTTGTELPTMATTAYDVAIAATDFVVDVDLNDYAYVFVSAVRFASDVHYAVSLGELDAAAYSIADADASGISKLTLKADYVNGLAVGVTTFTVTTDAGSVEFTVNANKTIGGGWAADLGVIEEKSNGELFMKGEATVSKTGVDLTNGFSLNMLFGDLYDFPATANYVEFVIKIEDAAGAVIETHFRSNNKDQFSSNFKLIQIVKLAGGEIVANEQPTITGKYDKAHRYSVRILGDKILFMLDGNDVRENGLELSLVGDAAFTDCKLSVNFCTGFSKNNRLDSTGTLVSMTDFDVDKSDLPAWAKPFYLEALTAPVLTIDGKNATWNEVEGATGYIIYIDGEAAATIDAGVTTYDISAEFAQAGTYSIQLKAKGDNVNAKDSALSTAVNYVHSVAAEGGDANGGNASSGKKGCKGSFATGGTVLALVALLGLTLALSLKKKKETK